MTTLTLSQGGFMDQQVAVVNTTLKNKPLNSEEVEKVFNEESKVVAHHGQENPDGMTILSDKAKKIWTTPHLRAGIILGAAAMATAVYVMLPDGSGSVQQIEGRDGVSAVEVTTETGEVNQDQAEYLARKQREEMQAKAAAGETNAAVLTTPTLIGETTEGSISSNTNNASDAASSSSVVTGLRIAGEVVDGNQRFNRIAISEGIFYQDLNTGQYYKLTPDGRALEPSLAPGARPEAASTNAIPEHAMANTQQTQGGNVGGGDGGSSGGAGGTGGPVEPAVPFNAEDDPDISRYRQNFAGNYDVYMAQNQNVEQATSQYQQQMLQNQQMLMQQRQSLAQSSVNNAIGRVNALTTSGSTYAPRAYSISSQGANGAVGGVGGASGNGSGISSQGQGGAFGTTNYGSSSGNGSAGLGISGGSSITAAADDLVAYNQRASNGLFTGVGPGEYQASASVETPQVTTNATGSTAGNQRLGGTAALPSHVVRAGTSYTVVVTKTVNSDYGNVVEARVVGGPFGGSTVYGQLVPEGRNAGIVFSGLQRTNVRSPIIPLNAKAVSLDGKNGIAQVKNHYLQNYTHMALTTALQGYGDAYANTGTTTTVERSDGTVITTSDGENTRREVEANIARELSQRLQQDTAHLGNRPPTYVVPAGTVVQMRFSQDWDTTQVANSIPQ